MILLQKNFEEMVPVNHERDSEQERRRERERDREIEILRFTQVFFALYN